MTTIKSRISRSTNRKNRRNRIRQMNDKKAVRTAFYFLVSSCKYHASSRFSYGINAFPNFFFSIERNAADRRFGFVLDLFLSFGGAVPVGEDEAALLDLLLELIPRIDSKSIFLAKAQGFLVDIRLDLIEKGDDPFDDAVEGMRILCERITAGHLDGAVFKGPHSQGEADGNTRGGGFGELPTRTRIGAVLV